MKSRVLYSIMLVVIFSLTIFAVTAQQVNEPTGMNPEWSKAYEPFRIVGNLYYVGTYDLACYLITTAQGNILINTGLAASAEQIKSNIEALGFKFADTKILLTTQAHFDHVGAIASIKKTTGAQMMVDEKDAAVLSDGGSSDYSMAHLGSTFEPVKADRLLRDKDVIKLGGTQLVMLHHPGHTKGSCSFLVTTKDEKRSYQVLIANIPTIIIDKKFPEVTSYPEMAKDYAYTLEAMKNLSFDLWVASHASQFKLHEKRKPGDAYNPSVFRDREGYDKALAEVQKQYEAKK